MTQEIQLRPPDALPDLADPFGPQNGPAAASESVFRRMHALLRRRYHWVVILALVLGGLGAVGGYKARKPVWSSTGYVRIKPAVDPIMFSTPENRPMTNYEAYVQSQVAYLRSQRVVNHAMQGPLWQKLKKDSSSPEAVSRFLQQLNVASVQRSEMVAVVFEDTDPQTAVAAVESVLNAYRELYAERDIKAVEARLRQIQERITRLTGERTEVQFNIDKKKVNFGTDDLRPMYLNKLQDQAKLESALTDLKLMLASYPASTTRPSMTNDTREKAVEEIAAVDPEMRQRLRDRTMAETELALVKQRKLGAGHPRVQDAKAVVELRDQAVRDYAAAWRNAHDNVSDTTDPLVQQRDRLEARLRESESFLKSAENDTKNFGKAMLELDELRTRAQTLTEQIAQTEKRKDELETEKESHARISIEPPSSTPLLAKDSRIQFGVLGGMAGVMLAFAIMLSIGARDRRLHNLDDLRPARGRLTLLGVLPSLPDDLADPTQASIAAHCVHQIRTLLQIGAPAGRPSAFTITSPTAGTGKTSLCLSLGVSFAASNARTLMIDCDLVGGGLTRRVDAIVRRKIGQIFTREGLITPQQLETALRLAHNSQRKLGEILVELGYLTPQDVQHALTVQDQAPVGMLDALGGESFMDCVADTGIEGLWILPLGAAGSNDASRLSPTTVRALIEQAKSHFDTILIDTGPVPGSLEAAVVAAASDGVVLVVSRGEHRPLAEKSIQHLQEINARVAGIVFNRAERPDLQVSMTHPTARSAPRSPAQPAPRFGPVAMAVAKPETPRYAPERSQS